MQDGSISVVLPTRLRSRALERSLASLRLTAAQPFEVLLAVDEDDHTDYSPYQTVLRCVRYGYAQLHEYYNLLAERAVTDWLFLWNDDATMATHGWDDSVRRHDPSVVLSPDTVHRPMCTFPIVPTRFARAIGHFSLNAHCDSWWEEIGVALGILVWPAIRVNHHRADLTGENRDSVFRERVYQSDAFNDAEMTVARARDIETIRALL